MVPFALNKLISFCIEAEHCKFIDCEVCLNKLKNDEVVTKWHVVYTSFTLPVSQKPPHMSKGGITVKLK